MIIGSRKTTLTLTDTSNDMVDLTAIVDVTDMTAIDYTKKIADLMRLQGYHDASILAAFREACFDLEEYLESVVQTKQEWETKYESNQEGEDR